MFLYIVVVGCCHFCSCCCLSQFAAIYRWYFAVSAFRVSRCYSTVAGVILVLLNEIGQDSRSPPRPPTNGLSLLIHEKHMTRKELSSILSCSHMHITVPI